MMTLRRPGIIVAAVFIACLSRPVWADHPNNARGFDIGKPYQMNGIDNVNLFNGSLTVTIPIGQRYHVNGSLGYGLTLVYNSNLWDTVENDLTFNPPQTKTYPNRRSNAGMGWLLSLGRLFPPNQFPVQESGSWNYETPDGALHDFGLSSQTGAGPFNTTDGSYLRLVVDGADRRVEFPDGTWQVFQQLDRTVSPWVPATTATGIWRLTAIHDRFNNVITIAYSNTSESPEIWTIGDGLRTQTVYFANAKSTSWPNDQYDVVLDRVVLTAFGSSQATWQMAYSNQVVYINNPGPHPVGFFDYHVHLPVSLTLPPVNNVSQVYSMRHPDGTPFYNLSGVAGMGNGALLGLQLPTGGWMEWDYAGFVFTTAPDEAVSRSLAVGQRRLLTADRSVTHTWSYNRAESTKRQCLRSDNSPYYYPSEQLVVSVKSPELVTTVHYFSIYQAPNDAPCVLSGAPPFDGGYGLPITAAVSDTFDEQQRYLSEETYLGTPSITTGPGQYRATGGTLKRSEWSLYRGDMSFSGTAESAHATKYDDDMHCGTGQTPSDPCYTSVTRYLPDSAGHYRQSSTGGNFPSGNYVTSFTNYTGFNQNAWILNRFTEQCRVEDDRWRPALSANSCGSLANAVSGGSILSGPHVDHFCFDTNGFLARHRKLASLPSDPASPAANDLVSVYAQTAGNVTQEDYYGGDAQNSMPVTNFCTTSFGTPAYSVAHAYSNGSLTTSQYLAANGKPAPGFLSTDNTIDANTGLVSSSRDAAGFQTDYLYDALGRITSATPPISEAPTTYSYAETTLPFKVTAQRASSSGTIQAITEFDSFGRVAREQQTLPATTTSRITTYTGSGWVNTVSQWENTPSHNTSYVYDPFGRPLTITAPDLSTSTLEYFGARTTKRTINVGTVRSGTSVLPTPTTTTETYDAQGRLSNLHDAAGDDTSYTYDVSGHLTKVLMGVQTRLFAYDGRGFLTSEQHPELNGAAGTVFYGGFDARGHAGTKLLGTSLSDFDLAYTYDAAERLRQIDQITARSPQTQQRPLKIFTFGDTAGSALGKLSQDVRHNYRGSDDFKVTQDYTYRSTDGKLTDHRTTIDKNTTRLQQFTQSYNYTDVGALATVTYPTCPDVSRPCGASTLSAVSPVFAKGMVTSLPGFADITYHDDGTVNQIAHPGNITDTYEADDHAMGRPKSIAFQSYDSCTPPSGVSIGRTPSGTLTPQTTVQLTATPAPGYSTPITYQWYRVVNAIAVPINGATSSTFSEAVAATTTYRVRVANGCGGHDSSVDETVQICSPLSITVQPASQSTSPATLSVTATGCGTLSYQWYQVSGTGNLAVGTNSPTFNTGSLAVTTTFWVKVTDSQGYVNSNNAVVTVSSCTPQITDDLHDQAADYLATVNVHITVSGCVGKSYHWYSGQAGDTSTPLLGGLFNGSPSFTTQGLNHGPIWVLVDGDNITPVNSRTAMISLRPISVNAALTVNTTNQISVTWQANALKYLVRRCYNNVCDQPFIWNSGTSMTDQNRTVDTTYVYSIASVDAYGTASAYSNPDIATTMTFTPVVSGGVISRVHINELFKAVNLVRAANGSPPVTWSGILPSGVPAPPANGQATTGIYAAHITSLRTQMDLALSPFGIPAGSYTDPVTLTAIKAVHFTDLQARIR